MAHNVSLLISLVFFVARVRASLNVMEKEIDWLVAEVRRTIVFDERDLDGPHFPKVCSSLEGPRCLMYSASSSGYGNCGGSESICNMLSESGHDEATRFAVEGILPPWKNTLFSQDSVNHLVDDGKSVLALSALVSERVRKLGKEKTMLGAAEQAETAHNILYGGSSQQSKCYRLLFASIPPWISFMPAKFSVGLPSRLSVEWDGIWEIHGSPILDLGSKETQIRGTSKTATHLILRTQLGFMRFEQACIVRQLHVRALAEVEDEYHLVCGFLKGMEQWCSRVAQIEGDEEGAGRVIDAGNSVRKVDEVAFKSRGLQIILVEISLSSPDKGGANSNPMHEDRKVILLRRNPEGVNFDPALVSISADATVWDLNEVSRSRMGLKNRSDNQAVSVKSELGSNATHQMLSGLRTRRYHRKAWFRWFFQQFPFLLDKVSSMCRKLSLIGVVREGTRRQEPSDACFKIVWASVVLITCAVLGLCFFVHRVYLADHRDDGECHDAPS